MIVKDPNVIARILKVVDQYNTNVSTRFLRPLFMGIFADEDLSRRVSDLTEQADAVAAQGIHLDELYQQILGIARFVYLVRVNVIPNVRILSGPAVADGNRIYRDMALNNLGANISVLADAVNELYLAAVEFDRSHSANGRLVLRDIPEMSEIGRYLVK